MSNCEIQAGFFVLSPCGRSASKTCHTCGKYACERHGRMSPDGEFYCAQCSAEATSRQTRKQPGKGAQRLGDDWDDNSMIGVYHYRHSFYWAESFRPFDESDYAGFDERESFSGLDDELAEGGFFDS